MSEDAATINVSEGKLECKHLLYKGKYLFKRVHLFSMRGDCPLLSAEVRALYDKPGCVFTKPEVSRCGVGTQNPVTE